LLQWTQRSKVTDLGRETTRPLPRKKINEATTLTRVQYGSCYKDRLCTRLTSRIGVGGDKRGKSHGIVQPKGSKGTRKDLGKKI